MSKRMDTQEKYDFSYNEFLDIREPVVVAPIDDWTAEEWSEFHAEASKIAAEIPYKIKLLDIEYMDKHEQLGEHVDEHNFFELMDELTKISEKICALNVLYLNLEGKFIQSDNPL